MTSDGKGVETTSPASGSAALFSQLDTNHDGQLDRTELKVDCCTFDMPFFVDSRHETVHLRR
jgi:hypothetical protein